MRKISSYNLIDSFLLLYVESFNRKAATYWSARIISHMTSRISFSGKISFFRSFSKQGCGLVLTTGGTGISPRDVTPEAIRAIMRVELPGFGEVMRAESMKITPNAIISRNLAAVVDDSLVIALPGKPSGAVECLGFVAGAIPHGVAVAQRQPSSC